jgi:hypothetical protein
MFENCSFYLEFLHCHTELINKGFFGFCSGGIVWLVPWGRLNLEGWRNKLFNKVARLMEVLAKGKKIHQLLRYLSTLLPILFIGT